MVERSVLAWARVVMIVYGALSLDFVAYLATNGPEDALVGAVGPAL